MAAAAPQAGAGSTHEGEGMRYLIGVMVALTIVVAAPASANGWRNGVFQAQMQRPQPDRSQKPPPPPQREFRQPQQPPDRGQRDGRMSDQDRRDLHRDLDRANRELYKGRR